MYLLGIPLLIIPFAIYNMIAFLTPIPWNHPILEVPMVSGKPGPLHLRTP